MENLIKDIRYALRTILKRPGFSLIAIITLALGIGANSAIFSVVNAILWRPLPYPQPQQLVMAWTNHQARGGPAQEWFTPAEIDDWRAQNQVFSQFAAFNNWVPTLTARDEPESLVGAAVNHDMFNLLGIGPARGRTFLPEEDQPNAPNVAIISDDLWRARFNSDPNIVGKSISLNQDTYQVVGVMPAGFQFPIIPGVQIWRTLKPTLNPACGRGCIVLRAMGRMKDSVTIAQAQADVSTIASRLAAQYPDTNSKVGAVLVPLHEQLVGSIKRPLLVLLGAVGFVLLIACANVANLLLARAATREREMALRSALGASRSRVIRQLLTESTLLAFSGAAAGLALAYWLLRLLVAISPQGTPGLDQIAVDRYVLAFTVSIAAVTGIIFGLAPALQLSKVDLNHSLKDTGKGTPGGVRGGRLRSALVVAEMALALLLLIGSGLLMKSFILLQRVDPGFNPDHVVTLRTILSRTPYPNTSQVVNFYTQLLDRVKATPGVQSAATISTLPLSGNQTDTHFLIEGRPAPQPEQEPSAWFNSVSSDYFQTMQLRMVKGRTFSENDNEKSPPVAIISEAMARKFFPNEEPLGKRIGRGPDRWREIVGVVRDIKHFSLDTDAPPTMYLPMRQVPARGMDLVVRTAGEPLKMAPTLRQQVWAGDRNLAIANLGAMKDLVSSSITQQRFILTLLACFAGLALLLAAVGIYGVMSYAVTQRTHEIGIRVALGARVSDVLRLVVQQGMGLTLIGVAIGMALALALTRLMKSLLFNVTPTDATTFFAVGATLTAVALLACLIPARRATKVDPLIALRYE